MKIVRRTRWRGLEGGIVNERPAADITRAIGNRVRRRRERRPRVSMVQMAGKAPRKLTRPKMQEARRAAEGEKPASEKMVEL